VVNPTDPNIVYVANQHGVFRSIDGGVTWNNVTLSTGAERATDLAIDPTNPSVLYAGLIGTTDAEHGIYKTTDGGDTWTLVCDSPDNGNHPGDGSGGGGGAEEEEEEEEALGGGEADYVRLSMAPSDPQTVYALV